MPEPNAIYVIEIVGEGPTDIGPANDKFPTELPTTGVVPILVHRLCGNPASLRVKRRRFEFLIGKRTLEEKVASAKRTAYYNGSAGLVFVVDTEGNKPGRHLARLQVGRDLKLPDFPAVVGVAHPCIETWLLADSQAIKKAMGLAEAPELPLRPEELSAPQHDRGANPKVSLGTCASRPGGVASDEAWRIADLSIVRERCPLGFAAFADEVEARIKPIFA